MIKSKYRQSIGLPENSMEDWQEGTSIDATLVSPAEIAAAVASLASSVSFTTAEVNLGSKPVPNGSFNIAGSDFTVGKTVMISQAALPYTGKGTYSDEIEMDQIVVSGYVKDTTTIVCHWGSNTKVVGNVKFNYLVGT
jgi:hypothetical protein